MIQMLAYLRILNVVRFIQMIFASKNKSAKDPLKLFHAKILQNCSMNIDKIVWT